MEGPVLEGLLSLSGRRSRRSYAKLLCLFLACQVAFLYAAIVKSESWAWELYLVVATLAGLLHMNALAQRLRDTGKPGVLAIILFAPVIGVVIALMLAFRPGQRGANVYGPDPLHDPLLGEDWR